MGCKNLRYFPNPCKSGSGTCPNGMQLNQHNKYFLMNPRYERAGTVGFRCAADLPAPPPCSDAVCATFEAPSAFTDVTSMGTLDWAVPMANDTAVKGGVAKHLISKITGESDECLRVLIIFVSLVNVLQTRVSVSRGVP